MKERDLRVWWIPQVPMNPFYVDVKDKEHGKFLLKVLANYDIFQFENDVKPDYSNAGGLQVFEKTHEGNLEWSDWYCPECGEDIYECECE